MERRKVISIHINIGPYASFIERITELSRRRVSSYVCVANVHMLVEAYRNPSFTAVVDGADLVTPDGMPLAKAIGLLHGIRQERVAGMDLVPDLLRAGAQQGLSVYLYGSTPQVLDAVLQRIEAEYPRLTVAGTYSPPFRQLTPEEGRDVVQGINDSGAHLVLVALGCPKQEIWMAAHRDRIEATMVGIGGALPVYAGLQNRAPLLLQRLSLEWLYRLCQEPRRLFRRYLVTNSTFLLLLAVHYLSKKKR